jgi:hypothetical protein
MTKGERIAELVRRLEASSPVANANDALHLVTTMIDEIEDQFSGVPNDPSSPEHSRMGW